MCTRIVHDLFAYESDLPILYTRYNIFSTLYEFSTTLNKKKTRNMCLETRCFRYISQARCGDTAIVIYKKCLC